MRRLVFGPDEEFEHYLGCKVAACMVDGYRPRDDLVYVTYGSPGRQLGRFTLRGDRTMLLFIFRAGHDSPGVAPKDQLRNEFSRRRLGITGFPGGARRRRRFVFRRRQPGPHGQLVA